MGKKRAEIKKKKKIEMGEGGGYGSRKESTSRTST